MLLSINFYMAYYYFGVWSLVIFFTNWCLEITLSFVLYLMYCATFGEQIHSEKKKLACLHMLYELAFIMNIIVVIVYWAVIHQDLVIEL